MRGKGHQIISPDMFSSIDTMVPGRHDTSMVVSREVPIALGLGALEQILGLRPGEICEVYGAPGTGAAGPPVDSTQDMDSKSQPPSTGRPVNTSDVTHDLESSRGFGG